MTVNHVERRAALEAIATKHGHALYYIIASDMALASVKAEGDGEREFHVARVWDTEAIAVKAEACALALAELGMGEKTSWRVLREGAMVRVSVEVK